MADIQLDDLLAAKKKEDTAPVPVEEELPAILKEEAMTLTAEERAKVDTIKDELDLRDSSTALTFGQGAQKELADFSDSILSQVRAKDSGEVGTLLTDLVKHVKGFEPAKEGGLLSKIPLIGGLVSKAEDLKLPYEKLSTQVDRIANSLDASRMKMMKDVALFDTLFEKNLTYFRNLQLYIQAGEEKLTEMRDVTLPRLRAQAQNSGDPMAIQVVQDFESNVDRFEKKVHDLKISRTIAIQTAPQIRLIQNNDKALVDRVQTAIYSTLPLWRNQLVIALGLSAQKKAVELQRAVSDMTNDLLKKNSEMLKTNTLEVAKENERGVVDIETVRKVNENLIATLEETLAIQQQGRAKRQAAEQELVQIENKVKDALLKQRQ